jgi:hypothetical protein
MPPKLGQVNRPAIIEPDNMLGFIREEGRTNEETIYRGADHPDLVGSSDLPGQSILYGITHLEKGGIRKEIHL